MPARGIHHVDLAVADVDRSLAFYLGLLGPLGLREETRSPTYRGTEEVVYLRFAQQLLGLRPADDPAYRYYAAGIEHLAFYVDTREEVRSAHERAVELGAPIQFPPQDYGDGCCEVFVFDPDGIRVEICCCPADYPSTRGGPTA